MPNSPKKTLFRGGLHLSRHFFSVAIWLMAVVATVWIFQNRRQQFDIMAIAQSETRQISSVTTGRLQILPVRLFEDVRQGQTLAVLENDLVAAELATANAETARLRSVLLATEDSLITAAKAQEQTQVFDYMTEARQFAIDLERTRIQALGLETTLREDEKALEGKELLLKRAKELNETNDYYTDQELEIIQTEYEALAKRIEENRKALAQSHEDLEKAKLRNAEFVKTHPPTPSVEKALEPLRQAIAVQERVVAELSEKDALLVLHCPLDGVVSQLARGVGETVMPGEWILTIVAHRPSEIIAYVPEDRAATVKEGMGVEIVKHNTMPIMVATSTVMKVEPAIELLPARLWRNPAWPQWGRRALISVPEGIDLLPGELVGVRGTVAN